MQEYIPGVTKGLEEMMGAGALAGFPVVDVTATLYDGSYHDVDSSVLAFQIAARGAFREGMSKGGARLLEPIMKVRPQIAIYVAHARAEENFGVRKILQTRFECISQQSRVFRKKGKNFGRFSFFWLGHVRLIL